MRGASVREAADPAIRGNVDGIDDDETSKHQGGKNVTKTKQTAKQLDIGLSSSSKRKGIKHRNPRAPRIFVSVGQKNIDGAQKNNSSHCMTAEAMSEQLPKYKNIAVDIQTIRLSDPERGLRYVYLTPRVVQQSILAWDQGRQIKPFAFKLAGAQIVSRSTGGVGKQKKVHKLGRRRLKASSTTRGGGVVPDIIGGAAPPKFSHRREFGIRAMTLGDVFDLPTESTKATD